MHLAQTVRTLSREGGVEEHVARTLEAVADDPWNAYVTVDREGALDRARELEAEGPEGRPLYGCTVSVKDNLAVQGLPLTCASRALEGYVAPRTATAVERLEAAGAVVVGKGNLDEFGCGSSGENSAHGPTGNPAAPDRVPGGSSSGAGATLAAEQVDLALGTDTGGSTRCPAAFCGVTALKPSYGRVSRAGLVDLAMSLEGPAPMTRRGDVEGLARALSAMEGPDPRDPVTLPGEPLDDPMDRWGTTDPDDLTLGLVPEMVEAAEDPVAEAVRDAAGALEDAGATLVEAPVEGLDLALPAYYVLMTGEFASAMQRFDGLRYGVRGTGEDATSTVTDARARLGPEVKRRILLGTFGTTREHRSEWMDTAHAARRQVAGSFRRALQDVDALLAPTMPTPAFPRGERVEDPLAMYAADLLTVGANLASVPAGSVPIAGSDPPVGLQVLGSPGEDATVLEVMRLHGGLQGGGSS